VRRSQMGVGSTSGGRGMEGGASIGEGSPENPAVINRRVPEANEVDVGARLKREARLRETGALPAENMPKLESGLR